MKRIVLLAAAATAIAVPAPAAAATRVVEIKASGFVPTAVTVNAGDTVRWTNRDTVNHQVVSDTGHFVSPILRPGRSYSRTFDEGGTFRYHDGLEPAEKGRIIVRGPPPSVTIGASVPEIVYGTQITVSGVVSSRAAGETVSVWAQAFPQTSFVQAATVMTGTGGIWSLPVTASVLTSYKATWGARESAVVTVGVRPSISLRRIGNWFVVRVQAARSFSGREVQVQRLNRFGQWVTLRKTRLNRQSAQRFKLRLPAGTSFLRIAMSVNQTGAGYLGAFSKTIRYRR